MGYPSHKLWKTFRKTGTNNGDFSVSRKDKKGAGPLAQLYLASSEEVGEKPLENLLNSGVNLFAVLPKSPDRLLDEDFGSLLLKKRKELSAWFFFHVYLLLLLNNFWHKANHNITHILKFSNQLGNIANILATASDGLSIAKLTKQPIREDWNGQRAGVYNCGRKIFCVYRGVSRRLR